MFIMKNILIKFKFQLPSAKVNVKVAVLRNMLLAVRCFHLWPDSDIIFHTNFRYGNIFDKFVLQHEKDKVKVTVSVRRKLFSLFWPSHL